MIVELSTDFSEAEKELLKEWADIGVKLYIDLNRLVDYFYVYDEENGIVTEKLIEEKAIEIPRMIPNRIICVDVCHHLVERKNELGAWYVSHGLSLDGTISCAYRCDDLESALKSI